MEVGVSKIIITPPRGLPLAGYFNARPNEGVLDDLHVRCALFRQCRAVGGVLSLDVCMLSNEFVEKVLAALDKAGFRYGRGLILTATHTHTAPYVTTLFGTSPDALYLRGLVAKTVEAVLTAERNLAPATLRLGRVKDNPLAFNRRYWMQGGGVTTNPGVKNPGIVKPEGTVDREIGILSVEQGGRITALLANIVNHTDTVGESLVSADWPGRLERCVQASIGYDPLVMTLIGCAGNVNQFDVHSDEYQGYAYDRAWQLGKCYAELVVSRLGSLKKLKAEKLAVVTRALSIPYRNITREQLKQARAVLAKAPRMSAGADMTSEGLATGEGAVARFFAEQLLEYSRRCAGRSRRFRMVSLGFGAEFALTSLPGEPFTEIGLSIKKLSTFKHTWPVALAMGACGYVALPECFERGGYETLPVVGGAPREDTAERLIKASAENLEKLGVMN
ncbi:MAG: hypothetical protein PHU80_04405 [Kiritimatiellae bacterium]|nr:hypothetical protein [Kiritimatiellia bacterium]